MTFFHGNKSIFIILVIVLFFLGMTSLHLVEGKKIEMIKNKKRSELIETNIKIQNEQILKEINV